MSCTEPGTSTSQDTTLDLNVSFSSQLLMYSESEEDGDAGDSDIDEVFKSTRLEDINVLLSDS